MIPWYLTLWLMCACYTLGLVVAPEMPSYYLIRLNGPKFVWDYTVDLGIAWVVCVFTWPIILWQMFRS